ncbi:MAG: hypothetical protein KTR24_02575 [Saprospiraceae bacterium]|nr:hypothetical protein [Saprospiraceae bacterium]
MQYSSSAIQAFLLLASLLVFSNCNKDAEPGPSANDCRQGVYDIVQEWYLWKDRLPASFNPADYETPAAVMEALRYKEDDRWSSVSDLEAFQQFFEEGTFVGIGVGLQYDSEQNIWITYVYEDSPAAQAGVERGWRLVTLGGQDVTMIDDVDAAFGADEAGISLDMGFLDRDGMAHDLKVTKATVNINTVLHQQVLTTGAGKVGYLVFKNFIETSRTELNDAFADFQAAGIDELILDFRYNGGGRVNIATLLAGHIAPLSADNQVLLQYLHNEDKQSENSTVTIDKQGALDFSRLVILTTDGTASASELMINGLRPYMDVVLIGGPTHGKPVGSYGFQCGGEFAVSPIAFRVANADGISDYFDGIEQDFESNDDLTRNFGDTQEQMLSDAIQYLETGSVSAAGSRSIEGKGIGAKSAIVRKHLPELSSF